MNNAQTEARLRRLLAELSRKDTDNLSMDEDLLIALDLDSLAALRMLAAVEKRFNVRFPDDQLSELRTLGRLVEAIDVTLVEEKPQ